MKGLFGLIVGVVIALMVSEANTPKTKEISVLREQVLALSDMLDQVKTSMPAACKCSADCTCCNGGACVVSQKPTAYCTPQGCFAADGTPIKRQPAVQYSQPRARGRSCRSCGS